MATEASGLSRPLALHVGGLAVDTQEMDLYEFFSNNISVQVASLRIVRGDNQEARYAYVNFLSTEDAEKALNSLNFKEWKGKEIVLSRSVPASHRKPEANLFVSELPETCKSEQLYNAFSPYGNILCARVTTGRPYGYVQFETVEAAAKAIEGNVAEIPIAGDKRQLKVEVFVPYAQRTRPQTNIFIRNFPVAGGAEAFQKFVEKFGKVTSFSFKTGLFQLDGKTPSQTGFGHADFGSTEEAAKALEMIPKEEIDGFKIEAFFQKTKSDRAKEISDRSKQWSSHASNLYVKHIPSTHNLEDVEAFFRLQGDVASFKPNLTPTGQRTGVFYVQYRTPDDAHKAILAARQQRGYYAAIHQPKPYRQQFLHKQYAANMHPAYQHQQQRRPMQRRPRMHRNYPTDQHGMAPTNGMAPHRRTNARRTQMPGPHQQQQQRPRQNRRRHPQQGQQQLTPEQAADHQRRELGEQLFWKVQNYDQAQAPKITGMLLEMQPEQVRALLQDDASLKAKVAEAQAILGSQAPAQQEVAQ